MTFEQANELKKQLDAAVNAYSEALRAFPKGDMGLTPDSVKASLEFKETKAQFQAAFERLRKFNLYYLRTFKAELKAERKKITLDRVNKLR